MLQKVVTIVSGTLLMFGALTTTTAMPMSIWQPHPSPTVTQTVTQKPVTATETVLGSYTRVLQKVTYTTTVVRKNTVTGVDGYAVRVTSPTKTLLNLNLTKSEAQRVLTFVQQYKPTTAQMLIARLVVLALL